MIRFKRGDTITWTATIKDRDTGEPIDTATANIRSQIRDAKNTLIDTFIVSTTTETGVYLFTGAGDSADYTVGVHFVDIELTIDDVVRSSTTFPMEIERDITLPEVT